MKRVKQFLNETLHTPTWLAGLILVVLLLRIPTFFEPYSYGDEMIYLTLGEAARRGWTLYKDIHDNKPPLLYLTATIAGNLFWFKAILAVWHVGTIYIFWKLSTKLFPKKQRLQQISSVIFALFSTFPLLEGNIANAENFMIGPIMLAFYFLLDKKPENKKLMLSGFLLSIATLFKIPAAFDLPAIIFLWIAVAKLKIKDVRAIMKRSIVLGIGFSLPILLTFIYYWLQGAFQEYLIAGYLQNFGYLSSWRPDDTTEPFLTKNGPLISRGLLVLLAHLVLFWRRRSLSKQFLFLSSWLFLTLFAVTLSERPYPHYLLQSLAPVSLLFGILFTKRDIEQPLSILPLAAFFFVPFYFNFWHYTSIDYYQKFIQFATDQSTKQQYFNTFGGDVVRNYKIAKYIKSNTQRKDLVYVWGDTAKIYALSNRLPPIKYIADYHINDFYDKGQVIKDLEADFPELVVILPDSGDFPQLRQFVHSYYGLTAKLDGAEIWRLMEPEVHSIIAP